jgi:hypothetical protein
MIKIGLLLLPWFPILIVCLVVYGQLHPEFLMDDGPWPRQHPVAAHVAPFIGLGSMSAFLVGFVLLVIAGVKRLVRLRHRSA